LNFDAGRGVIPGVHNNYLDGNTCGTGPYMLTEWTKSVRQVLTANPNYWGGPKGTGIAPTKYIIINLVSAFNSRKLDLLGGTADMVYWDSIYADQLIDVNTRAVLPAYASDVRVVPDLLTFQVEQIQFNENATLPGGTTGVISAISVNGSLVANNYNPFRYADFRKAFVSSFNFTAYYASQNGFETTINGFIPAGMVGHSNDVPYQKQDMTLAASLFAKVGWKGSVNLYYNAGNDVRKKAMEILQDGVTIASGGNVTTTVVQLTWPQYLNLMNSGQLPCGDIGWLPDYADPDDYATPYAWSGGTFAGVIFYKNTTVDTEVAQAASATSVTVRTNLYKDIDMTLYKQSVYLWLGQALTFHVERTWLHGWMFNPMFSGPQFYYMNSTKPS